MLKQILIGLTLVIFMLQGKAQSSMQLVSMTYHPRTSAKTLEYFEIPEIRHQALQAIDSIVSSFYSFPFSISEKCRFKRIHPMIII